MYPPNRNGKITKLAQCDGANELSFETLYNIKKSIYDLMMYRK
jgi:hypothetical protein